MLFLLTPFRTAPPRVAAPRWRTVRPRLEILEDRTCPSRVADGLDVLPPPDYGPSKSITAAPVLTLSIQMNGLKSVTLSGMVTATNPEGLTVTFSGAVTGTTTTECDGSFTLTIDADYLGTVTAVTSDQDGTLSNVATVQVICPPPTISGFCYTMDDNIFTLRGTVQHPDAIGMLVTIQGAAGALQTPQTVTVNSDGTFELSICLTNPLEEGFIVAYCTDCWGQQSNLATTDLIQSH